MEIAGRNRRRPQKSKRSRDVAKILRDLRLRAAQHSLRIRRHVRWIRTSRRLSFLCFLTSTFYLVSDRSCSHLSAITSIKRADHRECAECVKIVAQWVHLRTCQQCGVTLCCDSSPNRHASKHARTAGHPVIASAQPGERWLYCYPDDAFAEY